MKYIKEKILFWYKGRKGWNRYEKFLGFFPENQFGYIFVPKVACSSIKTNLIGSLEGENSHSIFRDSVIKEVENPQDYFIFTFVRNPFDRLVSCYKDKIVRKKENKKSSVFDDYLGGFLMKTHSFSDFINRIEVIPSHMWEPHFMSQYNIIYENEMGGGKNRAKFYWKV